MRVVSWLGCTSGRQGFHTSSFCCGENGAIPITDSEGHATGRYGEDDTLLPSERLGRKPVLTEPAPLLYTERKRLTAGASV